PDFNQIQAEIGLDLQQHQRMAYAILFDADEFTTDDLRARNIQALNIATDARTDRSVQLGALLDELIDAVDYARQPAPSPAQYEFAYDAFISYNEQDSHWVETILQPRLERAGLRLCLPDRDFAIGAPRIINMEKAVARSRKTLLILTPNWGDSQWSEFEGLLAQSGDPIGNRQRVLPVIVRPGPLPARLGYLTPLDLTNAAKFERQMQRLIDTIRADPAIAPALEPISAPGHGSASRSQSASQPARPTPSGGDGRLDYERGLRLLEQYVPADGGNDWKDFNLFKEQLTNNLSSERRYGATESTRAERSRVIDQINSLVLRLTGMSFTDLCLGKTLAQ